MTRVIMANTVTINAGDSGSDSGSDSDYGVVLGQLSRTHAAVPDKDTGSDNK